MSHVETGGRRFRWSLAIPGTSRRKTAGCVQCGSKLEIAGRDVHNHSGKCLNCETSVSDEDEAFEEFND